MSARQAEQQDETTLRLRRIIQVRLVHHGSVRSLNSHAKDPELMPGHATRSMCCGSASARSRSASAPTPAASGRETIGARARERYRIVVDPGVSWSVRSARQRWIRSAHSYVATTRQRRRVRSRSAPPYHLRPMAPYRRAYEGRERAVLTGVVRAPRCSFCSRSGPCEIVRGVKTRRRGYVFVQPARDKRPKRWSGRA